MTHEPQPDFEDDNELDEDDASERTYTPLQANNGMMLVVVMEDGRHLGAYTDEMLMETLDTLADTFDEKADTETAHKLRAASTLLWQLLNTDHDEE